MRIWHIPAFVALVALVALTTEGANIHAAPPANSGETALPVALSVAVPADAEIWLEGVKTTSTGTLRQFVTPALKPGQDYILNVRIRFRRNNEDVDQTRSLRVRAGDNLRLDYIAGNGERLFYFGPEGDANRSVPNNFRPSAPSYYTPRFRSPPSGINPPAGGPGTTW